MNLKNHFYLLPLILCFVVGCGPIKQAEPVAETSNGQAPSDTQTKVEQTNTAQQASSANEQVEEKTPPEEVSLDEPKVDHNDPTSYPITVLADKQEGQWAMLSWNVESDGADGEVVAKELAALNAGDRYDVIALTEVLPPNLSVFREALGEHYKYAYTKSGRSDRMQILYNENKFEKVRRFELKDINIKGRYRAPLVVHLKEKATELEFMVMVNHLARGKSEIRQDQANMLVEWARGKSLPIIGLGDYNFDYEFSTEKGNRAFANFMRDNIYRWVKPTEMVDTNWYDNPEEPDGKDDYPGSMLDFAFVSGPAKDWKAVCTIIVRENDFPDGEERSDHRPFEVIIDK